MPAIFFFAFFIVGVLVAVALATMFYAAFASAPYAATPRTYIREALKLAELKPGKKFYDLGSGDGRALIIAAKEFGADAVGFELSLFHFLLSKIKIKLSGAGARIRQEWTDFHSADIGDADMVSCWLTPKAFPQLADKFNKELKQGARVITFSSPLKFWEPDKVVELPAAQNTFVDRLLMKFVPDFRYRLFLYVKK